MNQATFMNAESTADPRHWRQELQASALFFLFFACLGSLYVIGFTVTETLFLTRHSQAQLTRALPWLYISNALLLALATWGYRYWVSRIDVARIIVVNALLACVVLAIFRQALDLPQGSLFYFALMLYFTVFYDFSATSFYAYLGNFFEMHQARRLYALICSGTAVANISSGYFVEHALHHMALADLLYVCMAIALLSAAIAWLISCVCARKPSASEDQTHADHESSRASSRLTTRYLALLALTIAASVFFIITLNYQFLMTASASMDEAWLASFLSRFYGYAGLALFASQALFASWMVRSLGVMFSALTYPLLMMAGVLAMLASGGPSLALVAPVFFLAMILDETLWVVIREMLYLPLPNKLRLVSQAIGYGQVGSIGKLLAGLCLLVLAATAAPHSAYLAVLLVAVVVWIAALALLKRDHRSIMLASLGLQAPQARTCPSGGRVPGVLLGGESATITVARLASELERAAPGLAACDVLVKLGQLGNEDARTVLVSHLARSNGIELVVAAQQLRDSLGSRPLPAAQFAQVHARCARLAEECATLAQAWQCGLGKRSACLKDALRSYQCTLLLLLGLCHRAHALGHLSARELDDHHRLHNLLEVLDAVLPRRWRRPMRKLLAGSGDERDTAKLDAGREAQLRQILLQPDLIWVEEQADLFRELQPPLLRMQRQRKETGHE